MGWFAETARYALTAMRRTVSVLREGDGPAQLAPGPTLDDLDPIVTRVRSTGLDVALHVDEHLPAMEPQVQHAVVRVVRSEEHTSELPSLMRNSYAVFCLQKQRITTVLNLTA